ncbi:MAG: hypothetical protein HUU26_14830, partial [Gemmatimonadaceae bacterium]|nr:hypothetical protein [Gemmatimonadaceae bacterium]
MNPTGTNGWTLSPRGVLQRVTSLVVVALLLAVVLPAGASRLVGAQSQ